MSSKPFVSAIRDHVLDISGQLNIKATPGSTDPSGIKFYAVNNTEYVGLRGPVAPRTSQVYTLPQQIQPEGVLTTDRDGNMSWVVGGGGSGTSSSALTLGTVGDAGGQQGTPANRETIITSNDASNPTVIPFSTNFKASLAALIFEIWLFNSTIRLRVQRFQHR